MKAVSKQLLVLFVFDEKKEKIVEKKKKKKKKTAPKTNLIPCECRVGKHSKAKQPHAKTSLHFKIRKVNPPMESALGERGDETIHFEKT